ncbi:hypothetical protein [Clostridium sp. AF22-10]|uniref:hypothetical protein n=1 Tax=Clostridium sp. AF22-10 TaxID=2293004 RepID=UPI0011C2161F
MVTKKMLMKSHSDIRAEILNLNVLSNHFLTDLKEKDPVEIVFDDLIEVDALIDMLKRFKQESQEYIGVWKRSGN